MDDGLLYALVILIGAAALGVLIIIIWARFEKPEEEDRIESIKMEERMNKVLFISGKITGDENYKEKFRMAQRFYEALGYTVLNPAILPAGMSAEQYSRICLAMLGSADVVAMLPDWRVSLGASAEWSTALFAGKEIIYMKGSEE